MARRRSFWGRLRAAGVVGGITLGILLLFLLQFAIPYWIGPAGLVVVGFVDAAIYLEARRRRALRKRARTSNRAVGGPVDRHPVTHTKHPLEDEVVATIALIVFVVGFSMEGAVLQAKPGSLMNFVLFQVGAVMMTIAAVMWWPYEWRPYDLRSESEKYDTTEDH